MTYIRSKIILPLFFIALLASAALWRGRVVAPLVPAQEFRPPPGETSPALTFSAIALGGFRGIIADILWMRIISLQEESRVTEISRLSNWITTLKPHFISVWIFHAWNMAYNISVMFAEPEDRWHWIQRGIHLLRDRALALNPGNPLLLRELGWLYQHKIGFVMDSQHRYYKLQLAQQMNEGLRGPYPDYRELMENPEGGIARFLREECNLKLELMLKLDENYGPLDWRLPATHALYWLYQGLPGDPQRQGTRECHQMFCSGMAESFRHGRLYYDPKSEFYMTVPAFELLPNALRAFEESLKPFDSTPLHVAYANFMAESVVLLYVYNHLDEARTLYKKLIAGYPAPQGNPEFEEFVIAGLTRNLPEAPREDVTALVEGFLFQGWLWLAQGETERAAGAASVAELIWNNFMHSRVSEDHRQRTGLPPLPEIRRRSLQRALKELPAELSGQLRRRTPENREEGL